MAQVAKAAQELKDFPGLMSNPDAHDVPLGAADIQVNATCVRPGQLTVRQGFRVVTFES